MPVIGNRTSKVSGDENDFPCVHVHKTGWAQSLINIIFRAMLGCKLLKYSAWWRHQMKTFSVSLAICARNSPVTSEFPSQRPVTWSFEVFFDLRLNKRLSKRSWGWRFEAPSCSLWRHCNELNLFLSLVASLVLGPLCNCTSALKQPWYGWADR